MKILSPYINLLNVFHKPLSQKFIKLFQFQFPMAEEVLLTAMDNYLKAGIHIGTKSRTKYMEKFIYKVRADGLSVMNIQKIDERLAAASRLMSNYSENEIVLACRRENGWEVAELFSKLTGIRILTRRYKPGILTNPALGEDFTEIRLLIVADPLPDKNIMLDAARLGVPVIGLCDSNNESNNIDLVVPCNNKGRKSLGLVFWILAKEYLKLRGKIKSDEEIKIPVEEFCAEEE